MQHISFTSYLYSSITTSSYKFLYLLAFFNNLRTIIFTLPFHVSSFDTPGKYSLFTGITTNNHHLTKTNQWPNHGPQQTLLHSVVQSIKQGECRNGISVRRKRKNQRGCRDIKELCRNFLLKERKRSSTTVVSE